MFVLAISRCRKGGLRLHSFLASNSCPAPGDCGILLPGATVFNSPRTGLLMTLPHLSLRAYGIFSKNNSTTQLASFLAAPQAWVIA